MNAFHLLPISIALVLVSCATPSDPGEDPLALEEAAAKKPLAKPIDRPVGTVAVVNSGKRGRGFILVRPLSKSFRVAVGTPLECRDGAGLTTATMMRSAEDNRRFFVADILSGNPSEGEIVVAIPAPPEMEKANSGIRGSQGLPDDLDLNEPLSLPPLREEDVKAMEP